MTGPSTRLKLRVVPGVGRPGIVGRHGDAWKVRVSAAPERGKANEALLVELASVLDLSRRDVELVAGHSSRDKVALVRELPKGEIEARLESAAGR
ncbi:MAG TPA: DUF167 domain-containing protein [Gaiellaceae bacterium]|nr:DUF167 domain-containing protein [Gaiellaceae bacterium]